MAHCTPLALVLASLLLAAGCGDSASTPDAGPLPVDQCISASDLAILENVVLASGMSLPDGGVPDGGPYPLSFQLELAVLFESCADNVCIGAILTNDGAEECMSACLADTAAAGLSSGCIACQNETLRCGAQHCINVCLGSDEDLCRMCGLEHCGARVVECTGLPQELP